jgi:hypothetical protein
METLLQFALVLIVVAGAATFGISIVAGTLDLARLIWHRATHCALTPVSLHGEAVIIGWNLHGRPHA